MEPPDYGKEIERFCITCGEMVPIDRFRSKKRQYRCIKHAREKRRHQILGTAEKRAFNSMRTRANQDMRLLGMEYVGFEETNVFAAYAKTADATYKTHSLVPMDPQKPMCVPQNAVLIPSAARRFIMSNWRDSPDAAKYGRDLQYVMAEASNKM